jgi:cytochrome d ubiquinol oxidase subunit II
MLGSALGAIASGRVPIGNAAGNLVTSWLNPTSILCGALAVAVDAFLAAVYLAADARRLDANELERAFRARSLGAGVVAGGLAVAGLIVVHLDAERIYRGLTESWGLAAVIVSALAGLTTLALVWGNRFQLARASAALAVAAILLGWAAAQRPVVLPGLTLSQAAAPNDTLIALIISVVLGGLILAPSLGLLFRLVLVGSLDATHQPAVPLTPPSTRPRPRSGRLAQLAIGCLLVGLVLLTLADPDAAHVVGVIALLTAAVLGFAAVAPDQSTLDDAPEH